MTVTGHEDEFRRLFDAEASARLDELARLTSELRAGPADPDRLDTMFRHAHTIKGGAGIVGFLEMVPLAEALAERIEDLRAGGRADDETVEAIRRGIADLREHLARATRA